MAITEVVETASSKSNVAWGPVFAGAAIATAIGLVLLAFGAALGLTLTSPYEGEGMSPAAFAVAAGLWLLWVQGMSFYIGGYVAARLRGRSVNASEHEVDVRDGLHGLLVWATGVIAAAILTFSGIAGAGAVAQADNAPSAITSSIANVADRQVNESAAQERATDQDAAGSTETERRAEIVRKLSIISAFITAASLLLGAVAAFYGAHSGGHHRDRSISWVFFNSTARLRP